MSVTIEVCVDNPHSLEAAIAGGADRIELCSALSLGGLTPSRGFTEIAAGLDVPVHAMIRPRDGDFEFDSSEIRLMLADIHACSEAGIEGVVIGATRQGSLDMPVMSELVECAGSMSVTLHRAFDILDDRLRAIDDASALGIERILTSGGALKAEDGAAQIRVYVDHARDRLSIMAGAGIHADNAVRIIRETGVREIHGSFSRQGRTFDGGLLALGFTDKNGLTETDANLVQSIKRKVDLL
ncbi:MAG: copper homeostasis protein CutC [Alphaproteobacteria bacterium]|nr:copper homeostasis protein CutC [Alphaproteobacteria bacterium]